MATNDLRPIIAAWFREKSAAVDRPVDQVEFDKIVSGLIAIVQLLGLPGEKPIDTLERTYQDLLAYRTAHPEEE